MRIIGGELKRRLLKGPKSDRIRPALDKIKQAIFNILGPIEEMSILDLFAGTGAMGIEALSRGANHATFVDHLKEAATLIQTNLTNLGLEGRGTILNKPVEQALREIVRHQKTFDLVFVDPPYDEGLVKKTLISITEGRLVNEGGQVIVEHSPREPVSSIPPLHLVETRSYGQTRVSFFKKASSPSPGPSPQRERDIKERIS